MREIIVAVERQGTARDNEQTRRGVRARLRMGEDRKADCGGV